MEENIIKKTLFIKN